MVLQQRSLYQLLDSKRLERLLQVLSKETDEAKYHEVDVKAQTGISVHDVSH